MIGHFRLHKNHSFSSFGMKLLWDGINQIGQMMNLLESHKRYITSRLQRYNSTRWSFTQNIFGKFVALALRFQ